MIQKSIADCTTINVTVLHLKNIDLVPVGHQNLYNVGKRCNRFQLFESFSSFTVAFRSVTHVYRDSNSLFSTYILEILSLIFSPLTHGSVFYFCFYPQISQLYKAEIGN